MKPAWVVAPQAPENFFSAFQNVPRLTAQLLWNRSIRDAGAAELFLHPSLERDLHDPFLFRDMQKATHRILDAVGRKEKIALWGDYDCDGVCGTAILYTALEELGHADFMNIHIPDRNREGYGLTRAHLEELVSEGVKLIVTIDCGVTNVDEIAWVGERGIDVIVVDHHSVPEVLPRAYAILNPKDPRSGYPFYGLAGTGVAFKLALALISSSTDKISVSSVLLPVGGQKLKFYPSSSLSEFLDLVTLATLADRMPLRDENRAMVQAGLGALAKTERVGLRALIDFCGLKDGVSMRDVHFSLIPRINAMGRMEHASTSFRLLTTKDPEEVSTLIRHLDERNRERQLVTDVIVEEVLGRVSRYAEKPPLVFEISPNWTPGVLGLAAQRVMTEVARPVVLAIERGEDGRVSGNARALGTFNIVEVLHRRPDLFTESGGHPHAGGFVTTKEHLTEVKKLFLDAGEETLKNGGFGEEGAVAADAELSFADVSEKTHHDIRALEPFGEENSEPQFLFRGLVVDRARAVGGGEKHLKLRFLRYGASKAGSGEAIAFGFGQQAKKLQSGVAVDAVAKISQNTWNGRTRIELEIVDLDVVGIYAEK